MRKFWGWGDDGSDLSDAEADGLAAVLAERFGADLHTTVPPAIDDLDVAPARRVAVPSPLAALCTTSTDERVRHSYGKSYRDVVRAIHGEIAHPPDVVAYPRTEGDVAALLDWCSDEHLAAIPFGGGSSVVGGVEPVVGDGFEGIVTIDLRELGRVLDIDPLSRAARIEGGAFGPAIESQLRSRGLTLRHFPQSFEFSTLGGWIATRAGGHFATLATHIDDLVESLRVVTPAGIVATRRLPASGAGPSPDRLFLGSEGALGIVTEAWVRIQERPCYRAGGAVRFDSFEAGLVAARAVAQSGLHPSNCRLLDPTEALLGGLGQGSTAVLLVGFESSDHPLDAWAGQAATLCRDHGGDPEGLPWTTRTSTVPAVPEPEPARSAAAVRGQGGAPVAGAAGDAAAEWRRSFLRMPYVRDALVTRGVLCETFETACTWSGFDKLHQAVTGAVRASMREVGASGGMVSCRVTHVYPDGLAPYYTVLGPARAGAELRQWDTVKAAVSDAIVATGGTITHHHAVGRDHRPWYERQRPELFGGVLRGAKQVLDPAGVCNPGVLIRPAGD